MRFVRVLGKFLISVGVGVLLFVGWTLWGTGLYTAQQQNELSDEFAALPPLPREGPKGPPRSFDPGPGDPVFRLRIPSIDLNKIVVEGVTTEDLKRGPGHYPSCRRGFPKPLCTEFPEAWPGERGRVVVSGHRTTYGAPFWDMDKVKKGDEVLVETKWGDFTYRVYDKKIVLPSSPLIVIQELDDSEIVFTTCNPKFSAAERLIVFARMVEAA